MSSGHVLVIGCAAGPTSSFGVEADSRAIVSQQVLATTVATANAARDASGNYHMAEVAPDVLRAELEDAILHSAADPNNCHIVKIGAFFPSNGHRPAIVPATVSLPSIPLTQAPSSTASPSASSPTSFPSLHRTVIVDLERWFHADPSSPAAHDAIAAFRADILPHATVLCTSVDDALALLESAGAPIPPPRGIPDVKLIGIALRHLGPAHVVVQQEFVDEAEGVTSLQYVLCGPQAEPAYDRLRCQNPVTAVPGACCSVASITARLAMGDDVPEAVPAAFARVKSMVETGLILNNA